MTDEEYMASLTEKAQVMTKSQQVEKRIMYTTDQIGYKLARLVGQLMRRFGSDD